MDEEEKIARTIEKMYSRLIRYRNRLIKEAFKEIESRRLELNIRKDRRLKPISNNPTIYVDLEKRILNMAEVFEYSKNKVPSLYRRYNQYLDRIEKLLEEHHEKYCKEETN